MSTSLHSMNHTNTETVLNGLQNMTSQAMKLYGNNSTESIQSVISNVPAPTFVQTNRYDTIGQAERRVYRSDLRRRITSSQHLCWSIRWSVNKRKMAMHISHYRILHKSSDADVLSIESFGFCSVIRMWTKCQHQNNSTEFPTLWPTKEWLHKSTVWREVNSGDAKSTTLRLFQDSENQYDPLHMMAVHMWATQVVLLLNISGW